MAANNTVLLLKFANNCCDGINLYRTHFYVNENVKDGDYEHIVYYESVLGESTEFEQLM